MANITITITTAEAELIASILHEHTETLAESYSADELTDEQYEEMNTQAATLVARLDSLVEEALVEDEEEDA